MFVLGDGAVLHPETVLWGSCGPLAATSRHEGQRGAGLKAAEPVGLAFASVDRCSMLTVALRDGSTLTAAPRTRLAVATEGRDLADAQWMTIGEVAERVASGMRVSMPFTGPLSLEPLPPPALTGWLTMVLVGDGYLRSSPELCNRRADIHHLVRAELPQDAGLAETMSGAHLSDGYWRITGTRVGKNPVTDALRAMELMGKRAWEKHIPLELLYGSVDVRLASWQGLADTDGSVDAAGRIEFSSSSQQLSEQALVLLQSLGGRASITRRTGVWFTSPRQLTPKAARDSFRLTGVRLPDMSAFRVARKSSRQRVPIRYPLWDVRGVSLAGLMPAKLVTSDGPVIVTGREPSFGQPTTTVVAAAA